MVFNRISIISDNSEMLFSAPKTNFSLPYPSIFMQTNKQTWSILISCELSLYKAHVLALSWSLAIIYNNHS